MDQITFFRQFMVALHAHIRGATSSSGLFPPQPIPLPDVWPPCPILTIRISPNHFQTNKQTNTQADQVRLTIARPNAPLLITVTAGVAGAVPAPSGKRIPALSLLLYLTGLPPPLPLIGGGCPSSRSHPPAPHHYPPYTPGTGPSFAFTLHAWHCPWLFLRPYLKPLALAPALTVLTAHTGPPFVLPEQLPRNSLHPTGTDCRPPLTRRRPPARHQKRRLSPQSRARDPRSAD